MFKEQKTTEFIWFKLTEEAVQYGQWRTGKNKSSTYSNKEKKKEILVGCAMLNELYALSISLILSV